MFPKNTWQSPFFAERFCLPILNTRQTTHMPSIDFLPNVFSGTLGKGCICQVTDETHSHAGDPARLYHSRHHREQRTHTPFQGQEACVHHGINHTASFLCCELPAWTSTPVTFMPEDDEGITLPHHDARAHGHCNHPWHGSIIHLNRRRKIHGHDVLIDL